jgi:hypothetical protein
MKTSLQENTLKGSRNREIMGGLLCSVENLWAFLFWKGGGIMRVSKISWENGKGLEELIINGIGPIKCLADYLALNGGDEGKAVTIGSHIEGLLEEIEECLFRFLDDYKKTGCPDDVTSERP